MQSAGTEDKRQDACLVHPLRGHDPVSWKLDGAQLGVLAALSGHGPPITAEKRNG